MTRTGRRRAGWGRAAGAAVLFAAVLAGCASAPGLPPRPAPSLLPAGSPLLSRSLDDADAWLRHYLMTGQYDSALALLASPKHGAPRDALQRQLQRAVVLHYAGRHAESNAAFEWAEREADARYTKSVSRGAATLLVNDRVLAYVPSRAELGMIPYFRMKNYLALADVGGALVEARKTSRMLARWAEADACAADPFLHYFSGWVYARGGAANDAAVSLRLAERAYDACGESFHAAPPHFGQELYQAARAADLTEVADSAARRYGAAARAPGTAEIVVLLEHGFVAHRTASGLLLPLYGEELDGLTDNDDSVAEAAGHFATRLLGGLSGPARWGWAWDDSPRYRRRSRIEDAFVVKLAWPAYRLEASAPAEVRLLVGDSVADAPVLDDVSGEVVRDFVAQQPLIFTRAVARGMVKYLLARELERKAGKQGGELAGDLAGLLGNLAGNALEQADTRSWSLLPDRIALVRLQVPAGEHRVRLAVRARGDFGADTLELGVLRVRAGERFFLSRRLWGAEAGDRARFGIAANAPADSLGGRADSAVAAQPADEATRASAAPARGPTAVRTGTDRTTPAPPLPVNERTRPPRATPPARTPRPAPATPRTGHPAAGARFAPH